MADWLIVKKNADAPLGVEVTAVLYDINVSDVDQAVRQGFTGPGVYVPLRWDDHDEYDADHEAPPVGVKRRDKRKG